VALTFSWSTVCTLLVISTHASRGRRSGTFPTCRQRGEAELIGRVILEVTRTPLPAAWLCAQKMKGISILVDCLYLGYVSGKRPAM
jgi:hypothetical protein